MRVRFYGRSDVGKRRSSNEDSYVLCEDEGLGIVCDGMGGHESGEVASRMAVELISEGITQAVPKLLRTRGRKLSRIRAMAEDVIVEWTQEANGAIHARGREAAKLSKDESGKSQMGTTLALVLLLADFGVVAHVGDSRVYRMRDGIMEQLTEDHVIVADVKRHPADPRPARKRKYVTRALGTKAKVKPDVTLVDAFPEDLFLLCSDGLTDVVGDDDIVTIIERARPNWRKAIRSLIHLANKRGGPDNVTVVLAEVVGEVGVDEDDTEELEVYE